MSFSLSVVIPLYNEAKSLPNSLIKVASFLESHFNGRFEIVLVDDGSVDKTFQEAAQVIRAYPNSFFQLVRNEKNRGKGYSIAQGVKQAKGEWIFFMDSDLSTPLHFLGPFVERLERGADIVMASRFEKDSQITTRRSPLLTFLSWSERILIRLLTGLRFSDTQCGFKGFRALPAKQLFARHRINRFCFDCEILFLARKLGLKVETYPVRWSHNKNSRVRWQDPLIFVLDLLRIRWYARLGLYE